MKDFNPYSLGATLYVPAVLDDIFDVVTGKKYPQLRSAVICLEDAVAEKDLPLALVNLKKLLLALSQRTKGSNEPLIFIRPRNVEMAAEIIAEMPLSAIDGLVLPKFDLDSLFAWHQVCQKTQLSWMPTLETAQAHDALAMRELAKALDRHGKDRILALRIGGNDLLSCLGLRRTYGQTLYEGPLGYTIAMLVATFSSHGYSLTGPVYECLDDIDTLKRELMQDISYGLVGKTAIHPTQITPIQETFKVSEIDYQSAMQLFNSEQAVFKWHNSMAEPATHKNWAANILKRSSIFGLADENKQHLFEQK